MYDYTAFQGGQELSPFLAVVLICFSSKHIPNNYCVSSVQCAVKYTQWPPKAKTTWCKSNFTFHTWKSFPTYKKRGNYEEFTTIVFVAIFGKFGHWAATKTTRFCNNR